MKRKRMNFLIRRSVTMFFVAGAIVAILCVYLFGIISPIEKPTTFVVGRGASVSAVSAQMRAKNLIVSDTLFKIAVRLNGGAVQCGEYEIPVGAGIWRVARMLTNGQIATTTVVIPEGLTIQQIKKHLLGASNLVGGVECSAGDNRPVCDLHDGDLFPDTYYVARGTHRLAVLELSRKKMLDVQNAWEKSGVRIPAPLKNWNEVLILASIVQKETPRVSEMPLVASVYLNRLRKKMRLQADPTVVYALTNGLGDMQGAALLRGHLKVDSPYNTYKNAGLPPAPIANVGMDAIRAVLRPADTNYLFFVADGRGGHRFANSYEEHLKNHADWREIKKLKNKN